MPKISEKGIARKEVAKAFGYLLIVICLGLSLCHNYWRVAETIKKLGNYSDLNIFVEAGVRFGTTGQLYNRQDPAEDLPLESIFQPSSPVFKFPPAFQLQLLPLQDTTPAPVFYRYTRVFMAFIYLLTCAVVVYEVLKTTALKEKINPGFMAIAIFTAITSDGYCYALYLLNYEIPIFFMLILAYMLSGKKPVTAGILVGYLTAVKIYPGFMVLFFLFSKNTKATAGIIGGALFFSALAFFTFGADENIFYYQKIMPILLSEKISPAYYNMNITNISDALIPWITDKDATFSVIRYIFIFSTLIIFLARNEFFCKIKFEIFSLLMVLMLICMPNYWQSYQIFLFPAIIITLRIAFTRPNPFNIVILFLAITSLAVDIEAWSDLLRLPSAKEWLDVFLHDLSNEGFYSALLNLLPHQPLVVVLYALTKIKLIAPYMLWGILAHEIFISSPFTPQERSAS